MSAGSDAGFKEAVNLDFTEREEKQRRCLVRRLAVLKLRILVMAVSCHAAVFALPVSPTLLIGEPWAGYEFYPNASPMRLPFLCRLRAFIVQKFSQFYIEVVEFRSERVIDFRRPIRLSNGIARGGAFGIADLVEITGIVLFIDFTNRRSALTARGLSLVVSGVAFSAGGVGLVVSGLGFIAGGFGVGLGLLAFPLGETIARIKLGQEFRVVVGRDGAVRLGLARASPSDLNRPETVRVLDRP